MPKPWQRTCGCLRNSAHSHSHSWSVHVDSTGLGGKRVFQELQAMLPNPGKRLMFRDADMKNRLEMEPRMSITCHAVAVSSLDPPGPVLWHEVLALGYNIAVDVIVWKMRIA